MKKDKVIVIAGPTASGKTAVSIKVAKMLDSEIISADSVQVYKYMDIGSAKIREEEKEGIIHYMIDEIDPSISYNMVDFKKKADEYITSIIKKNKIPMIVGGTGFYIQSLIRDVEFEEENESSEVRQKLYNEYEENGIDYMYEKLRLIDERSCEKIHKNNVKRVIRAIEYYENTGNLMSNHNEEEKVKEEKYDTYFFVLFFENRDTLYQRVDKRVDIMIEDGLFEEVKKLLDVGVPKDAVSMQAIGYKEIVAYYNGEISYEEAIEKIKINTRHLVKRQYTWFKHQQKNAIWIPVDTNNYDVEKIARIIVSKINE